MPAMTLVTGAILGLGEAKSSFGQTLALIITFVIVMGGMANFLIVYIVGSVLKERKLNQLRAREYDAKRAILHSPPRSGGCVPPVDARRRHRRHSRSRMA